MAGDQKRIRVVFAGDQGTGKTSLIVRAKYANFNHELPSTLDHFDIAADLIDTLRYSGQELDQELKQADVVVLTHACDVPATLGRIHTHWLPLLRNLEVKVPVIVVGCKLDLLAEQQKFELKDFTSYVLKQNPEIEICIESSTKENIRIRKVLEVSRIAAIYPSAPLFDHNRILKPQCMLALTRIFRLLDTDNDGCLSEEEVDCFEDKCFRTLQLPPEMNNLKKEVTKFLTDGVYDGVLTLMGFYHYFKRLRDEGRLDLAWEVLKSFGWKDEISFDVKFNVKFSGDEFKQIEDWTRDMIVELTNKAVEFLKEIFCTYDTDSDGTLKVSEVEDILSTGDGSFCSKGLHEVAAELGGLSIDKFLSEWVLMTVQNPAASVMNLMLIGYDGTPLSAIRVTKRGCVNRDMYQSVFQCFVFGPKKAGKSALLNTLDGRPFSDIYIPTKEVRYAVNTVNILGEKKTLIMREIHKAAAKHLLSNKDALETCDIAVFVYDSSSKRSWKRTTKLLQKVKIHGYKGPFLIVATKDDLVSHMEAHQDSIKVCQEMEIDAPIRISSKKGDYKNAFEKIFLDALHSHLSIAVTDDGKSCKQFANCSLPFESAEALKAGRDERKKSVWMTLSTDEKGIQDEFRNIGGALCIHPSGILITSVIATCPLTRRKPKNKKKPEFIVKDPSRFRVWVLKGGQVREARLGMQFIKCGVLIYSIMKKDPSEQFDFVDLDSVCDVELAKGAELYGFIHEGERGSDFACRRSYNNYPIPPNDVKFWTSKIVASMKHNKHLERKKSTSTHKNAAYRTLYGVVDLNPCVPIEASDMHSELPLLQVSRLGLGTYFGQSGCPVFKCKGDDLLGVILFQKNCFSFVLPVSVLRYCYAQYNERAREKKRKRKDDITS